MILVSLRDTCGELLCGVLPVRLLIDIRSSGESGSSGRVVELSEGVVGMCCGSQCDGIRSFEFANSDLVNAAISARLASASAKLS